MEDKDMFHYLVEYEKNPFLIRSILQLIPQGIGSAIDVGLTARLQKMKDERHRTFFEEIKKGNTELTPEVIENEDFLHCFFATYNAFIRTNRDDKIKMFARLLNSFAKREITDADEYEEFLSLLDELSYREIEILIMLDKYESSYPVQSDENELQRTNHFWEQFSKEIVDKHMIPENEIDSVLTRLNRTGCYETFTGSYMSYSGGRGKLTPRFRRLKQFIVQKTST